MFFYLFFVNSPAPAPKAPPIAAPIAADLASLPSKAPTDYLLHVDSETGVPAAKDGGVAAAEEYFKTQNVEFDWTYTGEQLQNK